MDALFIGQTYIDVTMLADHLPSGDEKSVADDYAVSFGGNAVTAGFVCAHLGITTQMITTLADDWLGHMFRDMAQKYQMNLHTRAVSRSALSFIYPQHGKRAILRARDADYLSDFPRIDLEGCRGLHLDGHQPDAALYYAQLCRSKNILTSLDGGGMRANTHELLGFIDVAIVAERLGEQMNLSDQEMLTYLRTRGCKIGGITQGERGMIWYDENGLISRMPALPVAADKIIDTSGAGDVFHGAYMAHYLAHPDQSWEQHFAFARAASAYKIQHLGNEAGLPSLAAIHAILDSAHAPLRIEP
jgi:sugar/nucleoside kinase (ribokinase family)